MLLIVQDVETYRTKKETLTASFLRIVTGCVQPLAEIYSNRHGLVSIKLRSSPYLQTSESVKVFLENGGTHSITIFKSSKLKQSLTCLKVEQIFTFFQADYLQVVEKIFLPQNRELTSLLNLEVCLNLLD